MSVSPPPDSPRKNDTSAQDQSSLPYRPCVGIALFSANGRVFLGERIDTPGAWQMPQGGIDEGEKIEEAAFRELQEEIGTAKAEILEILPRPLRYDLPPQLQGKLWGGKYCGQEQRWVAMRFTGSDRDIDIHSSPHAEFSDWQWAAFDAAPELIVPFKKDIYAEVIAAFQTFSCPPDA